MTQPGTYQGMNGKVELDFTTPPTQVASNWTDITQWVRTENGPLTVTSGRQSEFDLIQPGQMQVTLDNTDGRWTPGNTQSPWWPNFKAARQVRYTETVGGIVYPIFTGYINFPDADAWEPAPVYQEVHLSAYDLLGRLQRMPPFVSTLGAHIMGSPMASQLVGYWTLADTFTWAASAGTNVPFAARPPTGPTPGTLAGTIAASATGVLGDDIGATTFTPQSSALSWTLAAPTSFMPTVQPGQSITICMWVQEHSATSSVTPANYVFLDLLDNAAAFEITLNNQVNAATTQPGSAGFASTLLTLAKPFPVDCWRLITAVCTPSTGACAVWNGPDDVATGTATAAGALTYGQNPLSLGDGVMGKNVAHVQVYVGRAMTYSEHLAQWQVGMYGFERQLTGARTNAILDYAGIPSQLRNVDPGVSLMQRAKLSGQTPASALADAVVTEQGRGFVDPSGRYTFHDRQRVYNV